MEVQFVCLERYIACYMTLFKECLKTLACDLKCSFSVVTLILILSYEYNFGMYIRYWGKIYF
jgi:hypothetical protein